MILTELLADLSGRGVQLWAESDNLRIRAPKGVLTEPLRDLLAARKEEILARYGTPASVTTFSSGPFCVM